MRRILSCLFLLVLACAAVPVAAQDASLLRIEQDKGQMVRLAQPATSVFIANPDIADLQVMSPTMVYLFGKRPGETSLIAVDANERVLMNRRVQVTQNLTGLERALRERFPNRQITATSADGALVLSGNVASPSEAEDARRIAQKFVTPEQGEVVNRLTVTGATQVMLRVRVSEVARSIREDFGFNWEVLGNLGAGYALGLASGLTDITAAAGGGVVRTPGMMNGFFRHSGTRWDINGLIDALARDGLVTILAEPNLVSASGETASFLAGGEFPIPVASGDRDRITIDYKQFGVALAFTPTVLGEDRISMRVRPEVSELNFSIPVLVPGTTLTVPALNTRRAETTVELASGQSFAIAGLLQNNVDQSIDKFPFLGDLPVLGSLFRSSKFQRRETELVIIVTPYIVRPVAGPSRLAVPTDAFSPTRFVDRVFMGHMTRPSRGAADVARPVLTGPVGHTVE